LFFFFLHFFMPKKRRELVIAVTFGMPWFGFPALNVDTIFSLFETPTRKAVPSGL